MRLRVMIADDQEAIRLALADLIGTDPGLEVVGVARDAEHAVEVARKVRPDLALLDVRMPGGGGPRATREIIAGMPRTRVIGLSAYEDSRSVNEMFEAGAVGYLVKGDSNDEILAALHRLAPDAEPPPS